LKRASGKAITVGVAVLFGFSCGAPSKREQRVQPAKQKALIEWRYQETTDALTDEGSRGADTANLAGWHIVVVLRDDGICWLNTFPPDSFIESLDQRAIVGLRVDQNQFLDFSDVLTAFDAPRMASFELTGAEASKRHPGRDLLAELSRGLELVVRFRLRSGNTLDERFDLTGAGTAIKKACSSPPPS